LYQEIINYFTKLSSIIDKNLCLLKLPTIKWKTYEINNCTKENIVEKLRRISFSKTIKIFFFRGKQ